MRAFTRVRAHAAGWFLVGLLGAVLVFVAAAAGPVSRHLADEALREAVAEAPTSSRDLRVTEPVAAHPTTAGAFHDEARRWLRPALDEAVAESWGAQRTRIEPPSISRPSQHASLTGEGVSSEPSGYMPLVHLHHQTGIHEAVELADGALPATNPARGLVEVMASTQVAEALGLAIGEIYHLLPGVAEEFPYSADQAAGPTVAITLTGVFQPRDPGAASWELDPQLLAAGVRQWPSDPAVPTPLRQATLVTDQEGIQTLLTRGLDDYFGVENLAVFRLDPDRLDVGWLDAGADATAALLSDPRVRPEMRVDTGLLQLFDEYRGQAAAGEAVVAVVAAGLVGTGTGVLLLAARLATDRRRAEVALLRARGASLPGVFGRFLAEAALVAVPAVAGGWLVHLLLPGRVDPGLPPAPGVVPLAVAAVALLVVPVAALAAARSPGAGPGVHRDDLVGHRARPARLTVEAAVLLLAGLGVLLLYRRGLATAGTDLYLSAVPVLIALATGLLALRLYPLPLRLLGALAARGRGAVGFLGFARAGRAAPASALPVLVLVLAVAVGGFAGAVHSAVASAQEAAALRAVGADVRVTLAAEPRGFEDEPDRVEGIPEPVIAAVADLAGVETVASLSRHGFFRVDGALDQSAEVLVVDAVAYQQVLIEVGAPGQLPAAMRQATVGTEPVPVLATGGPGEGVPSIELDGEEYPATVVGDVADLPALHGGTRWVLVPRQALADPPPVDQLLLSGASTDPAMVAALVGDAAAAAGRDEGAVAVSSRIEHRQGLATAGFSRSVHTAFLAGTAGAALGGLLAVGLALVVQARARGRTLSLLRTMGFSPRQARGLLLVELVPVAALAIVAGAAAGIAKPVLLAPALGLTEFTGGAPLPVALDLRTVAGLAGLLGVMVLGGALAEWAVHRRLGLGQVLRVD